MEVNQPMYQPTYRLRPKENAVFDKLKCERIIKNLLNTSLANHEYNEKKSAHLCCNLSEELKKRMKEESLDRYVGVLIYLIIKKKEHVISILITDTKSFAWCTWVTKECKIFKVMLDFFGIRNGITMQLIHLKHQSIM